MYWTAPELLRHVGIPLYGTPKGDVFSFAIIMWELMYNAKAGPYQDINLDPKGWQFSLFFLKFFHHFLTFSCLVKFSSIRFSTYLSTSSFWLRFCTLILYSYTQLSVADQVIMVLSLHHCQNRARRFHHCSAVLKFLSMFPDTYTY